MMQRIITKLAVSAKWPGPVYLGFALLVLGATPPLAAAAPSKQVQVANAIIAMVAKRKPVEAMVLLDDSEEQLAERQADHQAMKMQRADMATYLQRMTDRKLRLDSLKAKVVPNLVDPDLEILQDYPILPVMHVRIRSSGALNRLLKHGKILSIDENAANEHFLLQSLPLINQPPVATAGYQGAGATVAVLDTGADYTLPAFGSCAAPGGACKVVYAADFAPSDSSLDDDGHGTNVAGIALGVASDSKIAALDVFRADGYAYISDIIRAINWCVTNKATYNIASLNMSLGSGRYNSGVLPADSWGTAIQHAVDAGILVVAASGNQGYKDSLALPAAYANVVSVGAVYDSGMGGMSWGGGCTDYTTNADQVTCFSNSASFLTVLAPGATIDAAGISMSGTSQASPHVAGAAAVLRAAYPADTVNDIKDKLLLGVSVTDSNGISTPRLDLSQALGVPPPPGPTSATYTSATKMMHIPNLKIDGTTCSVVDMKKTGTGWNFRIISTTPLACE